MTTDIVSVGGADFCALGDFKLPLLRRGLTLVTGENRDTASASSNGASKSNLFGAVTYGLFEQTPAGHKGDAVIRRGMRTAAVAVEIERDGEPFIVSRRRGKGARIAVVLDGKSGAVITEKPDDVTRWVEDALALDYEAFCSTVFYAPGGTFFGDPRTTDAERKALLHRVLNTGPLEMAARIARTKASALRGAAIGARAKADAAVNEADRVHSEVERARAEHERHEAAMEEGAALLEAQAAECDAEAARLEARSGKFEDELERVRLLVANANSQRAVANVDYATAQDIHTAATLKAGEKKRAADAAWAEGSRASAAAAKFAAGNCPECGAPVDPGDRSAHAAHLGDVAAAAITASKEAEEQRFIASVTLAQKREALAEKEALVRKAEVENRAVAEKLVVARSTALMAEGKRAEAVRLRLEAAQTRLTADPWLDVAEHAAARLEALNARAARASAIAGAAEREAAHAEFWVRGFGPEGLPALLLDEAVPEMEERANEYLGVLSDGDIALQVTSTSSTKAGDLRERLGVTWTIEGVEGAPPSRGQGEKLKIATGLALMDVACSRAGQRPDLLMMDEVLDGLDPEGRARVVRLLRDLRSRRGTILVITHEGSMVDAFSSEVRVIKERGVARVEEIS